MILASVAFGTAILLGNRPPAIHSLDRHFQNPLKRTITGREVEIRWPKHLPQERPARSVQIGDFSASIGHAGQVLDPAATEDAWKAISANASNATVASNMPVWRIKVFTMLRADILNHGEILRPRRASLDRSDVDHLYQSLARAAVAIEAKARGKIRVSFDVESDSAEDFEDAKGDETPFDAKWLAEYLTPRVNGFDFQSDDKVYRGPWHSVWVVHPGLVDRSPSAIIAETPCHAFPYFLFGPGARDGGLAEAMASSWEFDVVHRASLAGYAAIPIGHSRFAIANPFPPSIVTAATAAEPLPAERRSRIDARFSKAGVPWSEAEADPLGKVGFIKSDDLSEGLGSPIEIRTSPNGIALTSPGAAMRLSDPNRSLDSVFRPGQESAATLNLGDRTIVFADIRFADQVGAANRDNMKLHGYTVLGATPCAVFSCPKVSDSLDEWQLLGLPSGESEARPNPDLVNGTVFDGRLDSISTYGYFKAEASADSTRRSVDVRMGAPLRQGGAVLFDGYTTNRAIDARTNALFKIWIKASIVEPILIRFESDSPGWPTCSARLFGRWPTPEDGRPSPTLDVDSTPDGEWRLVEIDLRGLQPAASQMRIRRVIITSDPLVAIWGMDSIAAAVFTVGEASFGPSAASAVPTYSLAPFPASSRTSENKYARAGWAYSAGESEMSGLIEALKDRVGLVRINAAAALARVKGVAVEAALAESLNTLDPRIAQQSMNALKNQGTEYAWNTILRFFNGAPAEGHRLFALRALAERKDPRSAGTLTASFAAPSWRTRIAGVEAIAAIGTEDANTLLMVFLQEVSPSVRHRVVELADPKIEKVCRRLLYTAVNDPSEAVRLASLKKLADSPIAAFRDEGFKGVRDESPFVRIGFLAHLANTKSLDSRQALQLGVVDLDARVRVAALQAWSVFPGDVKKEDLGSVFGDTDPRVLAALDALLKQRQVLGVP